jgi:hypothetical protein
MTDFASLGIKLDSTPVADGTKALDAFADAAGKVDAKVASTTASIDALGSANEKAKAKVMESAAAVDAMNEASARAATGISTTATSIDVLSTSSARVGSATASGARALEALSDSTVNVWRRGSEATKVLDAMGDATARTGQRTAISNGQMADTAKIMAAQAEQARAATQANAALGSSTNQLTLGQQQLIERFREQAATLGMSRSQLMAYQAAQMGLTTQTQQAIAAVKGHEDALRAAAKAKEDAAKASNQLSDALKLLASGYAMLKIGEYIKDSAMLAARYETLGVVMEVVGRNAGYTKTQMDAASEGIARQGITMIESRESAVKLVQAHVDLQHAEGLARIAQNAAVIGHINSSEAFDRLVNGIARGNVLILRNIGINVNLQSAYREMADSLGKTTKELTENERVEARRIAVFERGIDINDVYTKSMDTAGKQILSMQRYTQDFKTTFGETFNEALTIGVMALTDHLKDSNKAVTDLSKNHQLEEWGHDLTNVFVTLANTISNAYTTFEKLAAYSNHQYTAKAINADFDAKAMANSYDERHGGAIDPGIADRARRIESLRQSALAQENVDYVTQQAALSGNFDRFAKAAAVREETRTAKHKSEADARLKVDQEYAQKATALLVENSNKSIEIQQAAQRNLYKSVYVGTPDYRDTEGRESKPKVDQAENTRMADHLKRIETEVAAEKAGSEYMMRIDEMRHKAGELGDADFYERRKGYAAETIGYEIDGYNKQLAELRKHHSMTATEAEQNAKAIHDTLDKLDAAKMKYSYDDLTRAEEERLRQRAIAMASDDMVNKYMSSLGKEAKQLEDANTGHEKSRSVVEREEVARLDLAIAYQKQFMAEQLTNGATDLELAQSPAILKYLQEQRDLRERIAKGLDTADVDKANKKAADEASQAWKNTANKIETDLTNAILDGGGRGWKKLVHDMEFAFARMILQPILQPISGGIASMVNSGAPQAAGGASSMLGSLSSAGSLYSAYTGSSLGQFMSGFSGSAGAASEMLGGAPLTGAAQYGQNAAGSLSGAGGAAPYLGMAAGAFSAWQASQDRGAVGGGLVGTAAAAGTIALGGAATAMAAGTGAMAGATAALVAVPVWGWIALAAIAVIGGMQDGPEANTRLKFGSNNTAGNISINERGNEGKNDSYIDASGKGAFGTFGVTSSFWMSSGQPAVQSFIQTVTQTDDALAKFMTATEVAATAAALTGHTMTSNSGAEGSDPNGLGGLDAVFRDRITTIFNTVDPALNAMLDGFKGTAQDLATEATALLDYRKNLPAASEAIFGAVVTLQDLAALRTPTEAVSAALMRVTNAFTATNAVIDPLGVSAEKAFGAVGLVSLEARQRLIDAAGGMAVLNAGASNFAQSFLTDAEKMAPVVEALSKRMGDLGYAGVNTAEGYKDAVMDLVSSGALATQAGADTYVELLKLTGSFKMVGDAAAAITAANKVYQDQIDTILKSTMSASDVRTLEIKGLDASTVALYDRLAGLKDEQAAMQVATDAIAKAQATAADARVAQIAANQSAMSTFANALAGSIKNATDAAKALRAFNDSLKLGNLSALSKGAQYDVAKQAYGANPADQAAATAFLTASQARGGSKLDYARDFAAVIAGNSKQAAMLDTVPASIIAMFAQSKAWQADGSHAGGLNYVPFDGYKAVLHKGERVQTAAQASSGSGGGMSESTARELIAAINEGNKHSRKTAETLERVTKGGKALQTTAAA